MASPPIGASPWCAATSLGPVRDTVATWGWRLQVAGADASPTRESEFTTYMAGIRERFGRRPSLMAALATRGL